MQVTERGRGMYRRTLLKALGTSGLLAAVGLSGACSAPAAPAEPAAKTAPNPASGPSQLIPPKPAAGQLTGVLPASDLAVGAGNRFLVGLIDDKNQLVTDAKVHLRFFKVTGATTAQLRSEADATFRTSPLLVDKGVYVATAGFDEAGPWGVEVIAQRGTAGPQSIRLSFEVRAQSLTPAVGSDAPRSQTLTATTPAELEKICSARPADDFHRLSVADAIAQKKPLLTLFATPAFCTSRTCGPNLEIVQAVTKPYLEKLNVVHVEIYKNAQPPDLVPAIEEWKLPSEPWLFLINPEGKIAAKFEGGVTEDELTPAIKTLLGV